MEIFGLGITLLSIVIAYLAWSNGKWMKNAIAKIDEHLTKMDECLMKMDEHAEKRHMEVIELLKKGFGEIIVELKKN